MPVPYSMERPMAGATTATGGILNYWAKLARYPVLVLTLPAAGLLLGFIASTLQTRVYRAHSAIEFQELNDNVLDKRSLEPTQSTSSGETGLQTQVRVLQSESLLARVAERLHAAGIPVDAPHEGLRQRLGHLWGEQEPAAAGAGAPFDAQEVGGRLGAGLKIKVADGSRIIDIYFDWQDARVAAAFVNTLTQEYVKENLEDRMTSARQTETELDAEVRELKTNLEESEAAMQEYARTNGLVFTQEKDNLAEDKLKQLQSELLIATSDRIAKQARYDLSTSHNSNALPEVLDSGPLKDYQIKLTDLRRQYAELQTSLTPANTKVIKLEAQIAELERAAAKERGNVTDRIKNEYQAAQSREQLLKAEYLAQAGVVTDQSHGSMRYDLLKREVDTKRQLYNDLLQKVKEFNIASSLQVNHVRVVDPAMTPRQPYSPSVVWDGGIGLLCGAFLGVSLALMRDHLNRTLQAPGEVAAALNIVELGVIPSVQIAAQGSRKKLLLSSALRYRYSDHSSLLADSYHSVLASLFGAQGTGAPRVVVISSPGAADGKTTTVANLGIALAETRKRVLLIDGDLRKPRLNEVFGVAESPGLFELISSEVDFERVELENLVLETAVPNVFCIPAGKAFGDIAHVLHSERLPQLLERCRREFDVVVIDSPPMLQMPDARYLGRQADAMVLVFRFNQTDRECAMAVCQRLAQDGIPLVGAILNDWDGRQNRYGYGGYADWSAAPRS